MLDLPTFWRHRAATHGHTGWRDQVVYAYDQQERLRLVDDLLSRLDLPRGATAVDFGCGTGDFSRLLLDRGLRVVGYDPFVTPRLEHRRFAFSRQPAELEGTACDLVLSVTVLDHVLDDRQLQGTLALIARLLRPDGRLVMLEYALDAWQTLCPNGFQAFRRLDDWDRCFGRAGLALLEHGPAPHPGDSPSPGYASYRHHPAVRALRRLGLGDRRPAQLALRHLARRVMRREPPVLPHPAASPMKYMICTGRG